MSFLPGEKLRYAETHFKFKLPWSLLYKPWPEIIVDAPFQFVPGVEPMLWIVVRDANRFPTTLRTIDILLKRTVEGVHAADISIQKNLETEVCEQMQFIPVPLGEIPAGSYEVHCKLTVERNGETRTFQRWNLPRLKPKPLRFKVLNEFPPIAPGYVAGEMHCHTHYSADHVEYGATPEVLQLAGKAVGLDFVSCTDHAYDFAFTQDDYTKEADSPVPRFQKLREEIATLPSKDENGKPLPFMLAGEEVSAGNSKGENVHVTVMAPEGYIPGLGDCGRYWLDNKPTRTIKQVLQMTDAHCFAAHPFQQMGLLEKFIFRRGYWTPEDLQINKKSNEKRSIRGIQFWNGVRDEGFKLGREFWINELGKENYLLPIGGNDAHGDLNGMTAVDLPLISLKHTRAHIFGNVRTVVKLDDNHTRRESRPTELGMTEPNGWDLSEAKVQRRETNDERGDAIEERQLSSRTCSGTRGFSDVLKEAFAGDNCYITDGPALWWERDGKNLIFHARSNKEIGGGFRYIRIYGRQMLPNGKPAPTEEIQLGSLIATPDHADIPIVTSGYAYFRAECETATGKFALTSAARIQ